MASGSSSLSPATPATTLACVQFVPKSARPEHVSNPDNEEDEDDCLCILSLGDPFQYVIPSFQFLSVELRQIRVKGYTTEGEEKTYDMFMRNDPSLCRAYPAWIVAKDVTVIQVRTSVCPAVEWFLVLLYLYLCRSQSLV